MRTQRSPAAICVDESLLPARFCRPRRPARGCVGVALGLHDPPRDRRHASREHRAAEPRAERRERDHERVRQHGSSESRNRREVYQRPLSRQALVPLFSSALYGFRALSADPPEPCPTDGCAHATGGVRVTVHPSSEGGALTRRRAPAGVPAPRAAVRAGALGGAARGPRRRARSAPARRPRPRRGTGRPRAGPSAGPGAPRGCRR